MRFHTWSLLWATRRAAWWGLSSGSEGHAGALCCLLCHHLGLCLINSVCILGMNRGRQGERNGDRKLITCVFRDWGKGWRKGGERKRLTSFFRLGWCDSDVSIVKWSKTFALCSWIWCIFKNVCGRGSQRASEKVQGLNPPSLWSPLVFLCVGSLQVLWFPPTV